MIRRILSAVVSASIALSLLTPFCSAKAEIYSAGEELEPFGSRISVSDFTAVPEIRRESVEDASVYLRECLRTRTYEFSVSIPKNTYGDTDDAALNMLALALSETEKGDEGDYIRYAIKSYKYGSTQSFSETKLFYRVTYYTDMETENAVTAKTAEISEALGLYGKTDFEKIRAVYDYIDSTVTYAENTENEAVFTAYSAAVNKTAVCQGYALLLYRLLKDSGLSCRIISGTSRGARHVWNIVKIDNLYYLLDSTWDSLLGGSKGRYFMKGSADFDNFQPNSKHIPVYEYKIIFPDFDSAEFKAAYPISESAYTLPVYTTGDINGNGIIDGVDASLILSSYAIASAGFKNPLEGRQYAASDITGDGIVDAIDASCVLSYYAQRSSGHDVSLSDYKIK